MSTERPQTLQEQLLQSFKDGNGADLEIHVEDKKFNVSKFILCLRSNVFNAMLANDTEEKKSGIVKIKEFKPTLIEKFLLFLYTDTIENLGDVAMEMYSIADYYNVLYLKKLCLDQLNNDFDDHINLSTIYEYYAFAKKFALLELEVKAVQFIEDNLPKIAKTKEWKLFDSDFRLEMFQKHFEEEPLLKVEYVQTGFFGNIYVNEAWISCFEKIYCLKNTSDQKLAFKLSVIDYKHESCLFELNPTGGFIEPNEEVNISLKSQGEVRVTILYVKAKKEDLNECFSGSGLIRQIIDYWHRA